MLLNPAVLVLQNASRALKRITTQISVWKLITLLQMKGWEALNRSVILIVQSQNVLWNNFKFRQNQPSLSSYKSRCAEVPVKAFSCRSSRNSLRNCSNRDINSLIIFNCKRPTWLAQHLKFASIRSGKKFSRNF